MLKKLWLCAALVAFILINLAVATYQDLTGYLNISADAGTFGVLEFEVQGTYTDGMLLYVTLNFTGTDPLDITNVSIYNVSDNSLFGFNDSFGSNNIINISNVSINSGSIEDATYNFSINFTLSTSPTDGNKIDVEVIEIGGINVTNTSGLPFGAGEEMTIDIVKPSFEIGAIDPPLMNVNWTNNDTLTLWFNVTDGGSGVKLSSINVIATGGTIYFDPNTNCTGGKPKYECNATWYTPADGTYTINLTANDTIDIGSDNVNNSLIWSINVDKTVPIISLISPGNNSWTNSSTPQFIFSVTDNMAPNTNCTLRVFAIESVINHTNSSVINDTTTIIQNDTQLADTNFELYQNVYSWFIECTDLAINFNQSGTYTLYVDNTTPEFISFFALENPLNISIYDPVIFSSEFNETNVRYVGLDIIDLNASGNSGVVKIYKKPVTFSMTSPEFEIKEYWTSWNSEVFILVNGTHNTSNITVEMQRTEDGYYLVLGWLNESIESYAYFNTSKPYNLIRVVSKDESVNLSASEVAGNFTSIFMNKTYDYVNDSLVLIFPSDITQFKLVKVLGDETRVYAANVHVEDYALNSNTTYPSLQSFPLQVVTTPPVGIFVTGNVYDWETGELLNNTNVTVVAEEMKFPGLPIDRGLTWNNNKTVITGNFSIELNRTGRREWEYQLHAYIVNATGVKIKTSPIVPPLPGFMNMTYINLYLVNATTLVIRNESGGLSGMVMDTSSMMPLSFFTNVSEVNVTLPRGRNYTISWWVEPEHVNISEVFPCPPQSKVIYADEIVEYVNVNISCQLINVTGYIFNSTPVNFTSLEAYMKVGNIIPSDAKLPWFIFENQPPPGMVNDSLDTTTGSYLKQIISGAESEYILVAYASNATHWFIGYANVTNPTQNVQVNITLYPTTHNATHGWNATRFNFIANITDPFTNESFIEYVRDVHVEVYLSNYPNVSTMYWMYDSMGYYYVDVPLLAPQECGDCKVELMIFSPRFAPVRKKIKAIELTNRSINITLREFMMRPPEGNETLPFMLKFLRTGGTCDDPNPPTNCLIFNMNASEGEFDPLKAAMQGNVNIRLELSTGVVLQFINVDLIASGPPDAELSPEEIVDLSTSTSFGRIWKLGSMAPDIYSYALIGVPYDDSLLNEDQEVRIHIPYLYDDEWNEIWNATINGTNYTQLVNAYPEYSESEGWNAAYFNGTGVLCGSNNYSTGMWCWIDKTNNKIWFRIPHFSGLAPQESGTRWLQTDEACNTSSQCLSGNCLYGFCKPADWGCYSNAHCPSGYYCTPDHICRSWGIFPILPTFIRSWTEMSAGVAHIFRLAEKELGITQINVTIKNPALNVKISVKKLAKKPAEVTVEVVGKVYQYIRIETQNLTEENIDKAFIRFNVTKSWITDNNIHKNRVFLYRFVENEWQKLSTSLIEENEYFVYEAQTPGFSYFAIAGETFVCEEAEKRCVGDNLEQCINNTWQVIEVCEYGCNTTLLQCNPKPLVPVVCEEGTKKCVGNALQICRNNTWMLLEYCDYGCNEELLQCNPKPVLPPVYIIIGIILVVAIILIFKFK
jgi:PGF-pre-PGF domain-containing protein